MSVDTTEDRPYENITYLKNQLLNCNYSHRTQTLLLGRIATKAGTFARALERPVKIREWNRSAVCDYVMS